MRITGSMLSRGMLDDVQAASQRLAVTQRKLSSGRELTRPSDDPTAVARAMALRAELEGAEQHGRTVADAQAWTEVTDSALGSITDALHRARELMVAGATDSAGPAARRAAALELTGLIDTMKQSANASYAGRHVFAGTATDTAPFAAGADDTYAGDGDAVVRRIGPGVSVAVNVTGERLFGAAPDGLLASLRTAVARLESGTSADADLLRADSLGAVDRHLDAVLGLRAEVGSTANRLEVAEGRLADLAVATRGLLSETEDVDFARAMIAASSQRGALEAALKTGASLVQTSLLDFLR